MSMAQLLVAGLSLYREFVLLLRTNLTPEYEDVILWWVPYLNDTWYEVTLVYLCIDNVQQRVSDASCALFGRDQRAKCKPSGGQLAGGNV